MKAQLIYDCQVACQECISFPQVWGDEVHKVLFLLTGDPSPSGEVEIVEIQVTGFLGGEHRQEVKNMVRLALFLDSLASA